MTVATTHTVWMLSGGRAAHGVSGVQGALASDCRDFAIHGATLGPCKHVLAVELQLWLPAVVLDAFRTLAHSEH